MFSHPYGDSWVEKFFVGGGGEGEGGGHNGIGFVHIQCTVVHKTSHTNYYKES